MFKIFLNVDDWAVQEAIYHKWMEDNVDGYKGNTESWAKVEWNKHPTDDKWHLPIPKGHSDTGVELTSDWRAEE